MHGRRHPVDRHGRPVDIVSLPVNGQPVLVDMDQLMLSTRRCVLSTWSHPVEMQIMPVDRHCPVDMSIIPVDRMRPVNTTVACKQAKTSC